MKSGLLAIAVFALTPFTSGGQEIPRAGTVVPPRAVKSVRALYTPQARNAGIEGTVLVDAVVLTDGDIAFPREPMPYDVLWVLPAAGNPSFRPSYGRVIIMQE